MLPPISFLPHLRPTIWGGTRLTQLKGLSTGGEPIGECWEVSSLRGQESIVAIGPYSGLPLSELLHCEGQRILGAKRLKAQGDRFPLLIKTIDAAADLSLQVHPTTLLPYQEEAHPGKWELWYIAEAAKGAKLTLGLKPGVSRETLRQALAEGDPLPAVRTLEVRPEQLYYVPAGTLHAIGQGIVLVEIQPTWDATYRLWDYGRRDADNCLRTLHQEEAMGVLRPEERPESIDFPHYNNRIVRMFTHPECHLERIRLKGEHISYSPPESPSPVVAISMSGYLYVYDRWGNEVLLHKGESALFPADNMPLHFRSPRWSTTLLVSLGKV